MTPRQRPTDFQMIRNIEDDIRRYKETRRQLVWSFEEINDLYNSVDRLQSDVEEKKKAVEQLEMRRRLQFKEAQELEPDLYAIRQARKELGFRLRKVALTRGE